MSIGDDVFVAEDDLIADESYGMEEYAFAGDVRKRLSDLGIGNYQRPRLELDHEGVVAGLRAGDYFDGRLPTVIKKLSLDQLSALYSLYSNWYGYVTTQFVLVSTERSEAIRQKEFMLNHLKNYYRRQDIGGKKVPETAIVDAAKTDKRYIKVNARYEELNALTEGVEAVRKVADQDMKVISREVTIHQARLHKEMTLNGFGNRGNDYDYTNSLDQNAYAEANDTGAGEPNTQERAPARVARIPRVKVIGK
jgi:hypothetical protein